MKSIKILSLLLALLFAVSLFAACAGKNPGGETGSTTAAAAPDSTPAPVETDPVDENGYLLDDLPVLNYGNTDFNLFTWSNQTIWEWSQDEVTTGDLIKDAIVKRQIAVEDRMGIKLVVSSQNGDWDHRNSFIDTVYNSTQSGGTEAFDLIGQYTPAAAIARMLHQPCRGKIPRPEEALVAGGHLHIIVDQRQGLFGRRRHLPHPHPEHGLPADQPQPGEGPQHAQLL